MMPGIVMSMTSTVESSIQAVLAPLKASCIGDLASATAAGASLLRLGLNVGIGACGGARRMHEPGADFLKHAQRPDRQNANLAPRVSAAPPRSSPPGET